MTPLDIYRYIPPLTEALRNILKELEPVDLYDGSANQVIADIARAALAAPLPPLAELDNCEHRAKIGGLVESMPPESVLNRDEYGYWHGQNGEVGKPGFLLVSKMSGPLEVLQELAQEAKW